MLTFDQITCERGGNVVFKHLGFTLGEGGLLILKGANGSGKTSLLRMLAGLIPCQDGKIYWQGEDIKDDYEGYLSNIAMVGHKEAIDDQLTVSENLEFWASLSGNPELFAVAAKYFRLEKFLDTPCYMLSAGWKKRVALSRLVLLKAELWLLDEPFTNLDKEGREMLTNLIAARCDQGGMVIISSHADNSDLPFGTELDISEFA